MTKKKLHPNSKNNLQPFKAKDGASDLIHLTVRVSKACNEKLKSLPGDRSMNMRAAIEEYLARRLPPENT